MSTSGCPVARGSRVALTRRPAATQEVITTAIATTPAGGFSVAVPGGECPGPSARALPWRPHRGRVAGEGPAGDRIADLGEELLFRPEGATVDSRRTASSVALRKACSASAGTLARVLTGAQDRGLTAEGDLDLAVEDADRFDQSRDDAPVSSRRGPACSLRAEFAGVDVADSRIVHASPTITMWRRSGSSGGGIRRSCRTPSSGGTGESAIRRTLRQCRATHRRHHRRPCSWRSRCPTSPMGTGGTATHADPNLRRARRRDRHRSPERDGLNRRRAAQARRGTALARALSSPSPAARRPSDSVQEGQLRGRDARAGRGAELCRQLKRGGRDVRRSSTRARSCDEQPGVDRILDVAGEEVGVGVGLGLGDEAQRHADVG